MTVLGETSPFISVGAQPGQAFKSEIATDKSWQSVRKESAQNQTLKGGQYKDVFGEIQGRNIMFCLDTSGSMYEHLPIITNQLNQVLKERLIKDTITKTKTQFNMIEFSTLGRKWAEEPVTLNEESLDKAFSWLKALQTDTSTNTLDALLQAFADCTVDTVYLVTDGLPDQRPALVVECVLRNNRGRPLIAVSIGAGSNGNADLLLTDLASVTGGSFRPVKLPLKLPHPDELAKLPKGAVVLLHGGVTERHLDTEYLREESKDLRWSGDVPSAYPTVRAPPPPDKVVKFPMTVGGRLMMGKSVLARHPDKGDYHAALIVDQHSPTCFEVEFSSRGKIRTRCELCHIFMLQDALMHPISKGDHVLAPLKKSGPYEPGNVVKGDDTLRGTNYNGTAGDVMVVLYSGLTVMCRSGTALWIPAPVYNRMVTELRVVPSTKSSTEAVETLKISEHNPTSPHDLQDYILSTNNGPRNADVCGDRPLPEIADIPLVSPKQPEEEEDFPCDSTDRETIQTTLSQFELGEKGEAGGTLPGYVSGLLAKEGHFDKILGVPDHPRFREEEEEDAEDAVEEANKPVWQYAGKASEGRKTPTSKPLRPMSATINRVPDVKEREKVKREARSKAKQEKVALAKSRISRQLKERDAVRENRALLARTEEKKQGEGSREAEYHVVKAVSHAVQTDNKYNVRRQRT